MTTANTQTRIWMALKGRIDTLVPVPAMTIYEPDAQVDDAGPYILVSDIRNEPVRSGIGTELDHGYSGTLLLAIHYPIALPASYSQMIQMTGVVVDHFPADLRMTYANNTTCLRVSREPDVVTPYRDSDRRVSVVRIPWTSI